jgi:ABC-type dipeptide/oligopeptide/nickel transport system permease component
MGTSLVVAALVVAGGFAADVAYALLDPRVRLA